ncbi:MAG: hypothetical protein KGM47_02235, partial [Acidobacteriota bacterium]|nr:hypothetical protein [Acidobacteriota bacterium]
MNDSQGHTGSAYSRRLRRALQAAVSIFLLTVFTSSAALAWGPETHLLLTKWAMQTLPPPLQGYFEAYQADILQHANDPSHWMVKDRFEQQRHYIFLDAYGRFPYLKLPHAYQAAIRTFGAKKV